VPGWQDQLVSCCLSSNQSIPPSCSVDRTSRRRVGNAMSPTAFCCAIPDRDACSRRLQAASCTRAQRVVGPESRGVVRYVDRARRALAAIAIPHLALLSRQGDPRGHRRRHDVPVLRVDVEQTVLDPEDVCHVVPVAPGRRVREHCGDGRPVDLQLAKQRDGLRRRVRAEIGAEGSESVRPIAPRQAWP
jgi:hypothetical protein